MIVFVVARLRQRQPCRAYRDRVDPAADVQELLAEMLFADLDQVWLAHREARGLRQEAHGHAATSSSRELELMKRLQADPGGREAHRRGHADRRPRPSSCGALRSSRRSRRWRSSTAQKMSWPSGRDELAGVPCMQLSAKIEEEIAQLSPEERGEFLADLGLAERGPRPADPRLLPAAEPGELPDRRARTSAAPGPFPPARTR